MGAWRVSADLLASSRFTLSPLSECVVAMTVLEMPAGPWQQVFHSGNRTAYDEMLVEHPIRRELGARAWRPRRGDQPGWMADFLSIAPSRTGMTFDDELDLLAREWDDQRRRCACCRRIWPVARSASPRLPGRRGPTRRPARRCGSLRRDWRRSPAADLSESRRPSTTGTCYR